MPKKLTCSQTFLYKDLVKRLTERGFEGDYLDSVKKNLIKVYKNPWELADNPADFSKNLMSAFAWYRNHPNGNYWSEIHDRAYR